MKKTLASILLVSLFAPMLFLGTLPPKEAEAAGAFGMGTIPIIAVAAPAGNVIGVTFKYRSTAEPTNAEHIIGAEVTTATTVSGGDSFEANSVVVDTGDAGTYVVWAVARLTSAAGGGTVPSGSIQVRINP